MVEFTEGFAATETDREGKAKEFQVNEIKSIYGKTGLKEYLQRQMEENQLSVTDSKKAEMLSRVLGLQLPTTLITFSYSRNITYQNEKVNTKNTVRKFPV